MTAKSQSRLTPNLLRNGQYSGTISTILYNWPLFSGALFFGLIAIAASIFLRAPLNWLLLIAGAATCIVVLNIWIASFIVYDWGQQREYERLATLGNLSNANVVIDITVGKLRGTRGLLTRFQQGHYFVIDIYDPDKMSDLALKRARELEPPLEAGRRIYRRKGKAGNLPIPHNWADVIYCSFSLHEIQNSADRQAIFNEFTRILKPNGKLLIAEHGRDWPNFLVFGLGALSFVSPKTWTKHINKAGLDITHHERWRGLVHLWVAERKSHL
jgi:ubiquinone/menaquinone biosynthesis C-methylase UbiE